MLIPHPLRPPGIISLLRRYSAAPKPHRAPHRNTHIPAYGKCPSRQKRSDRAGKHPLSKQHHTLPVKQASGEGRGQGGRGAGGQGGQGSRGIAPIPSEMSCTIAAPRGKPGNRRRHRLTFGTSRIITGSEDVAGHPVALFPTYIARPAAASARPSPPIREPEIFR